MTTHTDPDRALRDLLGTVDPERDAGSAPTEHLLDRVMAAAAEPGPAYERDADLDGPPASRPAPPPTTFPRRHWQAGLLLAAAACSVALAVPTVLPAIGSGGGSTASVAGEIAPGAGPDGRVAVDDKATDPPQFNAGGSTSREDSGVTPSAAPLGGGAQSAGTVPEKLVRSGSVLVGTEEQQAARDRFVNTVIGLGGRVTSESVVTRDAAGAGTGAYAEDMPVSSPAADRMGVSYPYPWYPAGPGIWISVQVPVAQYEQAMAAARDAGEVIQLQQSSYDVGAQVSDVDTRIASLEASLERLNDLMDQAQDISDVIALEKAISSRQAELDSLRAQQRDLANQTDMSAVSLTLMSPADAKASLEPQPPQTWWESFLEGLEQLWSWLGQALLIVSPLVIAGAVIYWVRRRQRRSQGEGGAPGGTPFDEGGEPA